MEDDEGINQRILMRDPLTGTREWGLAEGGKRVRLGRSRKREKKQEQL